MTVTTILLANNLAPTPRVKRSKPTDAASLPAKLPKSSVPEDLDVTTVATEVVGALPTLSADQLTGDAIWRDSCSLTNTFRTIYSAEHVLEAWRTTSDLYKPTNFTFIPQSTHVMRVGPDSAWIEANFTFNTTGQEPIMDCSGTVQIVLDAAGQWKIWVIRTMLENYRGFGDVDKLEAVSKSLTNGHTYQNGTVYTKPLLEHYDCIVVGGGQAGLSVGGRLQALGVNYLIVDREPKVGDSWGRRYDSAKRKWQSDVFLSMYGY